MNETLKQFKENQKRNQENLEKLLDFVKTGEKYGIEIEESFKEKINSTIPKRYQTQGGVGGRLF